MRKSTFLLINLLVLMSVIVASCSGPKPTPETIIQTKVVEVEKTVPVVQTQVVQATPAPAVVSYAREETLYTSGTQWGPPSSWNPFNGGGYAMGTIGLVYETLYIYDPLADKFTPWLAPKI